MHKILRNVPPAQKIAPGTLENTRAPSEYRDATVKAFNDRYDKLFSIDPAKAKLISVRQDSFKPWLATVVLGEDIFDDKGKLVATAQRSTQIERTEFNKGLITVEREKDETPYQTWKKVETAAGLEDNELDAQLLIKPNAETATYQVAKNSLNWYGEVRVKFAYKKEEGGDGEDGGTGG